LHYNTHRAIRQLFCTNFKLYVEYSFDEHDFDGSNLSVRTFSSFLAAEKNEQKHTSDFGFFGYKNRAGAAFSAVPTPAFM